MIYILYYVDLAEELVSIELGLSLTLALGLILILDLFLDLDLTTTLSLCIEELAIFAEVPELIESDLWLTTVWLEPSPHLTKPAPTPPAATPTATPALIKAFDIVFVILGWFIFICIWIPLLNLSFGGWFKEGLNDKFIPVNTNINNIIKQNIKAAPPNIVKNFSDIYHK